MIDNEDNEWRENERCPMCGRRAPHVCSTPMENPVTNLYDYEEAEKREAENGWPLKGPSPSPGEDQEETSRRPKSMTATHSIDLTAHSP